jgi:Zn-dependent peptidase ImmA (M78 family)
MDLKRLAKHLNATIVALSEFGDEYPDAVAQLLKRDPGAFSAMTVPIEDGRRIIVVNDSHDTGRQNANIAHELAHIVLGHEFTLPIDTSGCRVIDQEVEEEANWLGPTILIPDEAALHILRREMSTDEAKKTYGVSGPLLRMRINASGARIRLERAYH